MCSGPPQHKIIDGMGSRLSERGGDAGWDRYSEAITEPRNVLGNRQHCFTGDSDFNHPAILDQRVDGCPDIKAGGGSGCQLGVAERSGSA